MICHARKAGCSCCGLYHEKRLSMHRYDLLKPTLLKVKDMKADGLKDGDLKAVARPPESGLHLCCHL